MAWSWVTFGAIVTSLATLGLVVVGAFQIAISRGQKAVLSDQHRLQTRLEALEARRQEVDVVLSWASVEHGGSSFFVVTNRGFVAAGLESLDIRMEDASLDRFIAGTRISQKGVMGDRSPHPPLVVQPLRSYEIPIGFHKDWKGKGPVRFSLSVVGGQESWIEVDGTEILAGSHV